LPNDPFRSSAGVAFPPKRPAPAALNMAAPVRPGARPELPTRPQPAAPRPAQLPAIGTGSAAPRLAAVRAPPMSRPRRSSVAPAPLGNEEA
jgi:hypothetical protein